MSRKKNMLLVTAGILAGVTMTGPAAHAAAEYLKALPSAQSFYLDGAQVALEAYAINGRNYIQLVELGELLGVTVTYRARMGPSSSPRMAPATSPRRAM